VSAPLTTGRVVIEVDVGSRKAKMLEDAAEWDVLTDAEKYERAYNFACEQGLIDVGFKEVRRE
jgi:hypothetical protein